MISFRVDGVPVPQGSARAFVHGGRAVVTSDNPALKRWRKTVTAAAVVARAGALPLDEPVVVRAVFWLPRPKTVKRSMPTGAREGDVDKLVRALLDGMTDAGVYVDDSRVVRVVADKRYGVPGVSVRVSPVENVSAGAAGGAKEEQG